MQWARPEICAGPHGMPRTLLARPGPLRTSPRTNSVLLPMRSKPHVLPRLRVRVRPQGDLSAGGNVTNSRRQSVSSYLMTSGCGTTSVGQYLTAELIPYGGWVVKGVPPRARGCALYGPAPLASRVLRIAARRPPAALDPGASTGPGAGQYRAGQRLPEGCAQPRSPLLWD